MISPLRFLLFFFFNDTATTEIYTLSLHDALPISIDDGDAVGLRISTHATAKTTRHPHQMRVNDYRRGFGEVAGDRKSTRLNSSHGYISYAVFCLKKKN